MARPKIKIDAELCKAMAAQGLSQKQIAKVLQIHYATLMKRKKESKEFRELIDRGRAISLEKATNALFNSAMNGNIAAIKYYLSNRDPDQWHGTERNNSN